MGMQISYSLDTEISKEDIIWSTAPISGGSCSKNRAYTNHTHLKCTTGYIQNGVGLDGVGLGGIGVCQNRAIPTIAGTANFGDNIGSHHWEGVTR